MHIEAIAFEHYIVHVIELWPDGPRKEAGLASARSALSIGRRDDAPRVLIRVCDLRQPAADRDGENRAGQFCNS